MSLRMLDQEELAGIAEEVFLGLEARVQAVLPGATQAELEVAINMLLRIVQMACREALKE